jgi:hypothetical protein
MGSVLSGKTEHTLNLASATAVGVDFSPTLTYQQDGNAFGSLFLFNAQPVVKNNNGSARDIKSPIVNNSQVTVQGDGAALTVANFVSFWSQDTFAIANAGTISASNYYQLRAGNSGATVVGSGVTLTNRYGLYVEDITVAGTLTNNYGIHIEEQTGGTNNTHILIGTATTGDWGIYQSTSTANYLGGVTTFALDPIIPDEAYSSSWNGVLEPPTKNAVYDKIQLVDKRSVSIQVTDGATNVSVADGVAYFTIPEILNGFLLTRAQATVVTAGTTNATTVMIHNLTDAQDMLSGAISIASGGTVGTVGTINTTYDDVATNDVIRIDVDSVSTTAPKGLMVVLEFSPA